MKHPLFDKADALTSIVIEQARKVHQHFGPGLLEKVYRQCLAVGLQNRGFFVEQEKSIIIEYESVQVPEKLRIDLLVDDCLVIECKAIEKRSEEVTKLNKSQCLTYLKVADKPLGLVINFGKRTLEVDRVILRGANGWEAQ